LLTPEERLKQRQKQIDLGKKTLGYQRYADFVPRNKRKPWHPKTPDRTKICSKRSWDGMVRKWRRMLHRYDPPALKKQHAEKLTLPPPPPPMLSEVPSSTNVLPPPAESK